jgi:hypothetical protein
MKKLLFITLISMLITSCGWLSEAGDVTYEQVRPTALLTKYQYFKDMSSSIDRHRANLMVYEEELKDTNTSESYRQQRRSEALGILAMYNDLVSRYNSDMAKINYSFCNVGGLPQSNLDPLPREFKPYILKLK